MRARVADDPDNMDWQHNLVTTLGAIGMVLQAKGDLAGAVETFRQAVAIHRRLASVDPTDMYWQRALAYDYGTLGEALLEQGDHRSAIQARAEARSILRALVERDPSNVDWRGELSWESLQLGTLYASTGNRRSATDAWTEAAEVAASIRTEAPPSLLATRAMALLQLDRLTEAAPLVARLVREGWDDPRFLEMCREKGLPVGQ